MCIYVKFGVGWALHKKGAYAYLSNALTSNVYILDQDKVQIAAEIANVASLAKLYETYGNLWTDRKSTRLNSSHNRESRMPSSA